MQALVCQDRGVAKLVQDYPTPEPEAGWARIRVTRAGICGTDLEVVRGYSDMRGVLGHEFVGVVDKCPDDPSWEGKRVAGEINVACGYCPPCRRGHYTQCINRRALGIHNLDGTFAEFVLLPIGNLHVVPDNVPDDEAVFTEPLAAATQILEQLHLNPSDKIVVVGAGKLGLLVAQVMGLPGCSVTLIGRHAAHLELARSWGLETVSSEDAANLEHGLADVVVDCTGNESGLQQSVDLVRPRGTVVVKSTYHGSGQWPHNTVVVEEKTLLGSRCGPFEPALRLMSRGLVQVRPLIAAVYPLNDALNAFEHASQSGVLKVMLTTE